MTMCGDKWLKTGSPFKHPVNIINSHDRMIKRLAEITGLDENLSNAEIMMEVEKMLMQSGFVKCFTD